jgi:hypothetical protein
LNFKRPIESGANIFRLEIIKLFYFSNPTLSLRHLDALGKIKNLLFQVMNENFDKFRFPFEM